MFRERIIQVGILAIIGLALSGVYRVQSPDPQEDVQSAKTEFFIQKAHSKKSYDMVIVGDSRALRGLAPEIMEEELPGLEIYNLSFHAGGMNQEIYDLAESRLHSESRKRSLLLAPTCLAFLPHKKANAQYREYKQKPRDLVWLYMSHPEWAHFFQPMSPSVYLRRWLDIPPKEALYQEFQPTGWIATDQVPRDDVTNFSYQREALANYRQDQTLVDEFIRQTREWVEEGITVFGLYPPAYEPRVAFEDSIVGFDRFAFQKAFQEAGGIWLESPDLDLITYDGSHLEKNSAILFSRATGSQIAQCWNEDR